MSRATLDTLIATKLADASDITAAELRQVQTAQADYVDAQDATLQTQISGKQSAGDYATNTALTSGLAGKQASLGFTPVPYARTITINGTTLDLSADRSWTIATNVGSVAWGSVTGTLSGQTDLQTALNAKAPLASPTFTGTVAGISKSMVGLGNVDNTSDANKPVSTAQATALGLKQDVGDYATNTALTSGLAGKAPTTHTHTASQITDFNTAVDARIPASIDESFETLSYSASLSVAYNPLRPNKYIDLTSHGNIAITNTSTDAASSGEYLIKNDTTPRTVSINGTSITINPASGAKTLIQWWYDGAAYGFDSNYSTTIASYLQGLSGYVGDGSKVLADNLTWITGGAALTQLATPTLTLTVINDTSIKADWTNVSNESSYKLERSPYGANTWTQVGGTIAANTITYTNTGLTASTHYDYRVSAIGDGVTYSNSGYGTANATTNAAIQYLDTYQTNTKAAFAPIQLFSSATNCMRIRRGSDNVEQDFGFVSGVLDTAGITTFLGGATGYVKTIYDQSGNSKDATQTTTTKQPALTLNALGTIAGPTFDGTDDTMRTATFLDSSFNSSMTVFEIVSQVGTGFKLSAAENGGPFYLSANGGNMKGLTGVGVGASGDIPNFNATVPFLSSNVYDGTNMKVWNNDLLMGKVANSSPYTFSTAEAAEMGSYFDSNFYWDGKIFCQIYMNVAKNDTQIRPINRVLLQRFGMEKKRLLLFDGHSIMDGFNSTGGHDVPTVVQAGLGGSSAVDMTKIAVSGSTIANLITRLTDTDPGVRVNKNKFNGAASRISLSVMAATNSIFAGATGASSFTQLTTYLDEVKSYGVTEIYVFTELPRIDGAGTFETQRNIYNSSVRSNAASMGYTVVDLDTITQLTDPSNATYYSDGLHPTNAGYDLIAAKQLSVLS